LERIEPRPPKGKREKNFPSSSPYWGEDYIRKGEAPPPEERSERSQVQVLHRPTQCKNKILKTIFQKLI